MPLVAPAFAILGLILLIQAPAAVAPTADVYGRVLDDMTFAPVPGAKVALYPVPFPPGHKPRSSVSDRNGEYAFTGIPEGFYRLGLYHDEYFPTHDMSETSVSLRGGDRRGAVDLMMSQGASISGHVRAVSAVALRHVSVSAVQLRGPRFRNARPSVHSSPVNALGEFRVSGLRPGPWVVVAHRDNAPVVFEGEILTESLTYYPGTLDIRSAQEVTLKSGGRLGDVDFALQSPPTFKLTGTLVDAKDLPVAGATVEIGGDWPLWGGTKARAHTDINGRFQLGPLIPEGYKIYVTAPGIKPSLPTMQTPSVKATIVDADVSDVVIRFPLR